MGIKCNHQGPEKNTKAEQEALGPWRPSLEQLIGEGMLASGELEGPLKASVQQKKHRHTTF